MSRMQTKELEGNVGAGEAGDVHETGILEGANRVVLGISPCLTTVYARGVAVATLGGDVLRSVATIENEDPTFRGVVYHFSELNWTHRGSMLKLQGENIANILGPSACLLRGNHRPIYHQRPGMDEVDLIVIDHNPDGLSSHQIFQLVKQRGF